MLTDLELLNTNWKNAILNKIKFYSRRRIHHLIHSSIHLKIQRIIYSRTPKSFFDDLNLDTLVKWKATYTVLEESF